MTELLQPGFHPDADQLSAFVEQSLPTHEREHMLAHLAVCPECRAVVALSLPQLDPPPHTTAQAARTRWFAGWTLALPSAVALAALAVFMVYTSSHRTSPNRTSTAAPPQMAASHPPAPPQPSAQQPIAAQKASPPPESRSIARVGAVASGELGGTAMRDTDAAMRAQNAAAPQRQASNLAPANQLQAAPPAASLAAANLQSRTEAAMTEPASPAAGPALAAKAEGGGQAAAPRTLNAPLSISALAAAKQGNGPPPLPSRLPVISMAARGTRLLAIDARNAVFLSEDGGQHWQPIPAQWKGRAVRATLVSYNAAGDARAETGQSEANAGFAGAGASASGGPEPIVMSARELGTLSAWSLTGIVADATGAVIADATVTVTAANAKNIRTVSTDGKGRYLVEGLPPGVYRIEVRARGFESRTVNDVTVAASMQSVANVSLAVGASTETVKVESAERPDRTQSVSPHDMKRTLKKAAKPVAEVPPPPVFEITTDKGQRWTSSDGAAWTRTRARK